MFGDPMCPNGLTVDCTVAAATVVPMMHRRVKGVEVATRWRAACLRMARNPHVSTPLVIVVVDGSWGLGMGHSGSRLNLAGFSTT